MNLSAQKNNNICRYFSGSVAKTATLFFISILLSISSVATVFNVNTTNDTHAVNPLLGTGLDAFGNISLRSALEAADAVGGTHTINLGTNTYTLTLGQIMFGTKPENITINGNGSAATILNMTGGATRSRFFFINDDGLKDNVVIAVNGVTFQNGYAKAADDLYGGAAILAGGGTGNALTVSNCSFINNIVPTDPGVNGPGGAICMVVSGNLTVDNCTFTGNQTPDNDGGAIYYILYNAAGNPHFAGDVLITNSNFSGNSCGANGGAISFSAQGKDVTQVTNDFKVDIHNNTFTTNNAAGHGGAVSANNGFPGSLANVKMNFNRISGNTASAAPPVLTNGLLYVNSVGSVLDAENNWWGCNSDPKLSNTGCSQAGGVSLAGLSLTKWLQLKTTPAPAIICNTPAGLGNTSTITTSFLSNSANEAVTLANISTLISRPVTWSATLGTLSAQQATIQAGGTATATFTSNGTGGTATVNTQVDNVPTTDLVARASITVNTLPIVTNPVNATSCTGGTVIFTSTITGTPAPTITWSIGGVALVNGVQGSGSTVSGQGTNTLTINNIQPGDAAVNYNVQAVNQCGTATSANATLFVNQVTGGTVGSDQTICSGGDPAAFTESAVSTGSGALTYQWQSSTTNCAAGFSNIGGATAVTYDPPAGLAVTTYYRRVTTSTLNVTPCTANSNCITVTVNAVTGGTVAAGQVVCSGGDPAAFTQTAASTGSGVLTYQWQSSTTDCATGFSDIGGATAATYDPPTGLLVTTYYRRVTTSTLSSVPCTANSNCITVAVNSVTGGTVGSDQGVCSGGDPALFTESLASTGSGALTYQWQISTTDCISGFADIGGANASTYNAPAGVLVQTYYRRVTTSILSGVPCTANSNCITVSITPDNTITLTSAAATNNQIVTVNNPIVNITYATTTATGATFSGLPAGVTGSWAADVVTISGSPTTTVGSPFSYTVTLTGGCGAISAGGTITVIACSAVNQTVSALPTSVCTGGSSTITVGASQPGVNYTLRVDPANTFVAGPTASNGPAINFTVSPVSTTTYNVLAETDKYSINLDGSQAGFSIPANAALDLSDNFTMEGWIKPAGNVSFARMFNKDQSYALGISNNQNSITFTRHNAGDFSSPFTFVNGTWYHIACTYVGGTVEFFVNGVSVGTVGAVPAIILQPGSGGQIGSDANGGFNRFNGNIDNVRIWNSVRTPAQIAANQTGFLTSTGNPTLVASWWIIEGTGNAKDYAANAIDATALAGTWQADAPVAPCSIVLTSKPTVSVTPDNTITLTSAAGTNAQTVCTNTLITNITYSTTGATGATFSGLPPGVTGNWAANVVTISGSPTSIVGSPFGYTVTLTGGCGTVTATGTITVNQTPATPTITPGGPTTFCQGGSVTLTSSSATGNQWYLNVSPLGGETNQTYIATASGAYTVVVTQSGCPSAPSAAVTVTVNPIPPTPTITPGGPTTFCIGGSVTLTSSSATGNQWYVSGNPIGGATNQNYIATGSGSYTVMVTQSGCSSASSSATPVVVNPNNTITLTSAAGTNNQSVLINTPITNITYSTTGATGATFSGLPPGVTGNWAGNVVTISGSPTSAAGSPYNYTVTLTGGCGTITATGTITVFLCVTNTWTGVSSNNWFTPGNWSCGIVPTALLNVVIPSGTPNPCVISAGTAQTRNLTINAGTTLTNNGTLNINGGGVVSTAGTYRGTGIFTGAVYNNNGGIVSPGLSPGCTLFGAGYTNGSGTELIEIGGVTPCTLHDQLQVTGTATLSGTLDVVLFGGFVPSCGQSYKIMTSTILVGTFATINYPALPAGLTWGIQYNLPNPGDVTLNILGTPTATATPASQTVCSAAPLTPIVLSGSPIAGTTYNWTRDNPIVTGIANSGTGNISGTLTNPTNVPVSVTFTITPTSGSCIGTPITATVVVNPTPDVNAVANQVVCNGAPTAAVNFTGSVAGTVFNWTNSDPSIGLAASGTGDIASFNAINTGTAPVVATVTVTPSTGTSGTATFNYTGSMQTWVVPPGVTSINIDAQGAQGGTGFGSFASGVGGLGGRVQATLAVTPGATLNIFVGGAPTTTQLPGYNGGGAGIAASSSTGGGGGGASDIRIGGNTLTDRVIVAGGGGGSCQGGGGAGGGLIGGNGSNLGAATVATGGTQVAGGSGGLYNQGTCAPGTFAPNGVFGVGGNAVAGTGNPCSNLGSAGGGGGWYGGGGMQTNGAAGGSGYTIPAATGIVHTTGFKSGNGVLTITYTGTVCTGTAKTFTYTVNPTPTAVATPAAQTICSATAITPIVITGNAVAGVVYNWTRDNTGTVTGIAASGSGNISGTLTNTTNTPITVTFTITPTANGCPGTPVTATVTVNPTPTVNAVPNQVLCNGAATTAITFTGVVTAPPGTVYNWTNSQPSIGLAANGSGNIASFTATNATAAPVVATITVTPSYTNAGTTCNGTPITFTITVNPTPTAVATPVSQTICSGSAITPIVITGNAVAGVVYNWTRDNAGTVTGIAASGAGNISGTLTNTTNAPVTVTFTITPTANGCPGTPVTATVTVNPTPDVNQPANQVVCNGAPTAPVNFTGSVAGTVFNWTNSDPSIGLAASGTGNIPSFIATNTGTAPVVATVTVTPSYSSGGGGPVTQTFNYAGSIVNWTVPAGVTSVEIQANGAQGGSGGGLGASIRGTVSVTPGESIRVLVGGAGGFASNGNGGGGGGSFVWKNAGNVLLVAAGGGGGTSLNSNSSVGGPGSATSTTTSSINGSGNAAGGAGGNGGSGGAGVASGATYPAGGGGGTGWLSNGGTGAFTYGATGGINPLAGGAGGSGFNPCDNINVVGGFGGGGGGGGCSGASGGGGGYNGGGGGNNWDGTTWGSGGGGGSFNGGSGQVNTAGINSGSGLVSITYAAGPTCTGTPRTFTYTVNPTPTATATPASQTTCSGAAITPIALTGTVAGTVFNWTRDNGIVTGIAASGSGTPISGTLTNPTNLPITVTFTITPTYTNAGVTCTGTPVTATVLVNPTPTVNAVANQVVCNGAPTTAVIFTGAVTNPPGTVYNWTNNTTSIGLAAAGTGNIASFTAINTGTAPVTATITVTPSYTNGGVTCTGTPTTFTITVNPTATVIVPANAFVCNGDVQTTGTYNFSTTATGGVTTYSWTNNDISIGLGASGTGNSLPTFTATNTTNVPITATITVTPTFTNGGVSCVGTPNSFSITVNPTPNATATPASQTICSAGTITTIVNTGTVVGTVFNWTRDNNATATGIAASGVGNISGSLTNTTNGPVLVTFTITPTYTNGGTTCTGPSTTATVLVNPLATVDPVPNQFVCNGDMTAPVNFTSPTTGGTIVYDWINSDPSIGLAAAGSGNIAAFTATNPGIVPVTATITVTPTYTNGGISCVGTPTTFTITVNPTPQVDQPANQVVCNGAPTAPVNFTGPVVGTVFNWTNNNTSVGLAASGAGNIPSFIGTNVTNAPNVATITVTPGYSSNVQLVSQYNPVGAQASNTPVPSTNVAPGFAASTLTQTGYTGWVNGNVWPLGQISNSATIVTSQYVEFTLTTPAATAMDRIEYFKRSYAGSGATVAAIRSSLDAFASNIATVPVNPAGAQNLVFNISSLNNVSGTVTFRIYFWGAPSVSDWCDLVSTSAGGTGLRVYATALVCTGPSKTFTITVNPTPTVDPVASQVVCHGSPTAAVNFTGFVPGTVFNWTNNNPNIGLAISGTGNIASFIAVNVGTAPDLATIVVTPSYTNAGVTCLGTPITFTITVNPQGQVDQPASQAVCNGAPTAPVNFTTTVPGTVFNWTNDNTTIGLGASGTGSIASFTAINATNAPVVATITVTPSYTNAGVTCTGTPKTFTITVNPTPTVNAVADQVVCAGALVTATFSGPVAGTVYTWTNSNTAIGLAASGTGNLSFIATNATAAPVTATITVTPTYTNGGTSCSGAPVSFTITVNPTPQVNQPASQVVCNGSPTAPVNFTGPVAGTVYTWTNNTPSIGLAASGTGDIASFTAINATALPVVATIVVTPTTSGSGLQSFNFDGSLQGWTSALGGLNCQGNNWAVNTWGLQANAFAGSNSIGVTTVGGEHSYIMSPILTFAAGTKTITFKSFSNNESGYPCSYDVELIEISTDGGATWTTLNGGSVANLNNVGNDAQWRTIAINATTPATTNGRIRFRYDTGDGCCGGSGTNNGWYIDDVVISGAGGGGVTCTGPSKTFTITVNPTPTVNAVSNKAYCTGVTTALITFSGTPGSTYNWTNDNTAIGLGASGTGDIAPFVTTNTTNGPLVATITVTPVANGCTGTPITFTITVNPRPVVNPVASQVLCNGSPTAEINFTSPTTGPTGSVTFHWTNSAPSIGLAANGTGNIPSFIATNTGLSPVTAILTVTVMYTNAGITCTGNSQTFTITVNPTPTVNPVASQVLCNGSNTAAVNFTGSVFGTIYSWTNNNTSIGLGASGVGNIASFTATNAGTTPQVATITVTPNYTNTITCAGTPITFTITVNPVPTVNPVANQTVCAGATVTQAFTGTVAGTVYNWTNSNTAIGLAASGTGNLNFVSTNTTGAPISGTITVTPTYTNAGGTCTGTPQTFTITVNPVPTVNAVASQVVCNGAATAAVTFTGAVAGTVYSWTNSNTTIGLAANGTGNIASFTATNITNVPQTATITVTPTYTNGGTTCTGTARTFTITVNPTPSVNTIANQTVCNGAATTAVTISGPVAGAVYNWTNNNTSIGLGASGTNTIPSFIAINTGSTPQVATITVTPTFTNGGISCTGTSTTFTITVNATAVVNQPASQVVCNGASTTPVTFSGLPPGSTYNWTNNNTAIGLAAAGTGNIPSFIATNNTTAPITATITVTPSSTGCGGTAVSFTITVNPTPAVNAIANQTVCAGAATAAVTISGPVANTVFTWTNNNTTIGLGASGIGNIPSFVTVNPTNAPVTATITVTPTYTNGGISCSGTPVSFTITVNPLPNIVFTNVPPRVCLTDTIVTLRATPAGGTWSGTGVSGNTFSAAAAGVGVHRVTYTVTNQSGCSTTRFENIVVNDCIERHNVFQQSIRIWPNPNQGRFSVQFNSDVYKEFRVKIVNAGGQEMAYYEFKNLVYGQILPFDLSRLAGGTYFLYVYNSKESGVFPIIIQR